MEITFTVPGKPVAKGRPKFSTAGGFVKTYTPAKTASYENLVKLMYTEAAKGKRFGDDEMLFVKIQAFFPIPSSASKTKKAEMLADHIRPIAKSDWDNIGKIICDALNGIAYKDDSRIVAGVVIKRYSETPGVIVHIATWGYENEQT